MSRSAQGRVGPLAYAIVMAVAVVVAVGPTPTMAAHPGTNGPIVFEMGNDLWRLDPGATTPTRITNTPDFRESHAAVSPDGSRVAFEAPPAQNLYFPETIWVMDIDGSNRVDITLPFYVDRDWNLGPTWSPDGTRVAFTHSTGTSTGVIVVAAADGSGGAAVNVDALIPANPAWSPVGNEIALARDSELWILDVASGQERLLFSPDADLTRADDPDWAPDGSEIVFSCETHSVCAVQPDGGGFRRLTDVAPGVVTGDRPAFSPDGTQVTFEGQGPDDSGAQVWTMPREGQLAGGTATQLTFGPAQVVQPTWAPAAGAAPPPAPAPAPPPPPPGPGGPSQHLDGDPATTERIEEGDATSAAIAISGVRFPPRPRTGFAQTDDQVAARHVVLSRDDTFPDSLAGSVLTFDGPLLLTDTDTLTPATRVEIDRVLAPPGRIYLLGGTGAVSAAIEQELRGAGYDVRRLAGDSRVETALVIADEAKTIFPTDAVLLARSDGLPGNETSGWADSVSAGGFAARTGIPVIITPTGSVHPAVAAWLQRNAIEETVLLGGEAALSSAVESAVPGAFRVAGAERTETAARIASVLWGIDQSTSPRAYVVIHASHPQGWAFGLAGAGLSSDADAPILMVSDQVSSATADLVSACGAAAVDIGIVGDGTIVTTAVETQLDQLDGGACGAS